MFALEDAIAVFKIKVSLYCYYHANQKRLRVQEFRSNIGENFLTI